MPEDWPWEEAKKTFAERDVTPADQIQVGSLLFYPREAACQWRRSLFFYRSLQLEWETPDVEGLVEFLVKEKGLQVSIFTLRTSTARSYGTNYQ